MLNNSIENKKLVIANHTILSKKGALLTFSLNLAFFSFFAVYFATLAVHHLATYHVFFFINLLFFAISILAIRKTITDRKKASSEYLKINNIVTARFKKESISAILRKLSSSTPSVVEFEDANGRVTRMKLMLDKPLLTEFKFDLVKHNIRVEEL